MCRSPDLFSFDILCTILVTFLDLGRADQIPDVSDSDTWGLKKYFVSRNEIATIPERFIHLKTEEDVQTFSDICLSFKEMGK